MTKTRVLVPVVGLLVSAFAACGGETPPPKAPEPDKEIERPIDTSGIKMQSELGQIDEAATKGAFKKLDSAFDRCEDDGLKRIEVLSGEIGFFVRVGKDGVARYGYVRESTVGDHTTEKCFLDAVLGAKFPKPDGGEAEVTYKVPLKGTSGRPATDWSVEKVGDAISAAKQCKGGASGTFQVTIYVVEAGHKSGKVHAVGVAAPDKDSDAKVDCIVKAMKDVKLPTPGTWPAKVSFSF